MAKLLKGEKFPDFTVDTHEKTGVKMSEIVDGKPTAILVIRYIGCTVCRYDVHQIETNYQKFVDAGVNVCVVMQSTPENVNNDLKRTNATLHFPIICDSKQEIYETLDIKPAESMEALIGGDMAGLQAKGALARQAGFSHGIYEGNEQQLPAFFFVDGDMTAKVAHYAKNIVDIPNVDEMLAIAKAAKWFD